MEAGKLIAMRSLRVGFTWDRVSDDFRGSTRRLTKHLYALPGGIQKCISTQNKSYLFKRKKIHKNDLKFTFEKQKKYESLLIFSRNLLLRVICSDFTSAIISVNGNV